MNSEITIPPCLPNNIVLFFYQHVLCSTLRVLFTMCVSQYFAYISFRNIYAHTTQFCTQTFIWMEKPVAKFGKVSSLLEFNSRTLRPTFDQPQIQVEFNQQKIPHRLILITPPKDSTSFLSHKPLKVPTIETFMKFLSSHTFLIIHPLIKFPKNPSQNPSTFPYTFKGVNCLFIAINLLTSISTTTLFAVDFCTYTSLLIFSPEKFHKSFTRPI